MVLVYFPGGLPSLEQHCGRSVAFVAICDGEQLLCPDVSGMQMDEIYQPKALAGRKGCLAKNAQMDIFMKWDETG